MEKREMILSLISQAKKELDLNKGKVVEFNLAEGFGASQFDFYIKQKIAELESRIATLQEVLNILFTVEESIEGQTYVVWTNGSNTGSFIIQGKVECAEDFERVRKVIRRGFDMDPDTEIVITFYKEV